MSNDNLQSKIVQVIRPLYDEEPINIKIKATVKKGEDSDTVIVSTKLLPKTEEEMLQIELTNLTIERILNTNSSANDIRTDMVLPTEGVQQKVTISWTSSNEAYISTTGQVTQPTYSHGNAPIILTATITVGTKEIEKVFQVTVSKMNQSDEEILDDFLNNLDIVSILGGNISTSEVTLNLNLPTIGPNGISCLWESSNPLVITSSGVVSRPDSITGNVTVNMTLTATRNSIDKTRSIGFTVLANA